jgi:hypothetical protein
MVSRKHPLYVSRTMLFNLGGAAMLGIGFYMAFKLAFAPNPETPLCDVRYASGVLFSLSRKDGTPLATEDLQARLGGHDRGLISNARIVKDENVPYGFALEVNLKRAVARDEDDQSRSGIGMTWLPRQITTATAACLSYNVWVPESFKGGEGGVLPGFASEPGAEEVKPSAASAAPAPAGDAASDNGASGEGAASSLRPFAMRPLWRGDGQLALSNVPNLGPGGILALDPVKARLKPGLWTRIEQEVVLNTPGQLDGIARMWVDGKIVWEQHGVGFRQDEMQGLQAVVGNVHNVRHGQWASSPVETRLRISPLELRLR